MTSVIACVVLIASPSASPVAALKSPADDHEARAIGEVLIRPTPMMKRVMPFMTNITPIETMTRMIGAAFCLR